jgi:hypothetical protein
MLSLESRKAIQWLLQDRARYWPDQLRKAERRVAQAKSDLERCQLHYGSEEAPSCFVQKKALEKAQRRMRECEEKVQAVKRWSIAIREELDDFDGELARMTNWTESDLPRAVAALERMVRSLDQYAGHAPGFDRATAGQADQVGASLQDSHPPALERPSGLDGPSDGTRSETTGP